MGQSRRGLVADYAGVDFSKMLLFVFAIWSFNLYSTAFPNMTGTLDSYKEGKYQQNLASLDKHAPFWSSGQGWI